MSNSPEASPPPHLQNLRKLLIDREGPTSPVPSISVWPPTALDCEHPPADVYFYRPGELLVPAVQAGAFEKTAQELGFGPQPAHQSYVRPGPDDASHVRVDVRQPDTFPTAAARFTVNEGTVERVIVAVKERNPGLTVTPNHVIFSCQNWLFEPDGEPRKPAPGQEAAADGGGHGIVVAVIDTGLPRDYGQNPLLEPVNTETSELEPFSYQSPPQAVLQRSQGHGAFVAGVVRQFAQHATVWSYRALDNVGTGDEWALGHQLAEAMSIGPPRIINLSLGTVTRGNQAMLGLSALGTLARQNNGSEPIVIAAAGNLDLSRPFWPAADTWAISVGAAKKVGRRWEKAHFSDFGKWVDVCADGVDILSSYAKQPYQPASAGTPQIDFDGWAIWNGTSFATPLVTGVVADLLAQPGNAGLSHFEVLALLKQRMVIPRIGALVL